MPACEPAGPVISMSGCSARNAWSPGHLVLAGRRHDVHNGPPSCHCHDRGQGDQRHFLTGVQQGPRLPASEHAPGGLACRFPGARRHRGPESAQPRAPPGGGRRRGTDAPVIADPARPAGQPAARPGRCARRSDRRGSSILRFRAPAVRAARADRRAAALAAAAALTCPVRTAAELRRLAMEPEQLAGEHCLNAGRPVHEHPPVSGGRPAGRPQCATGAHRDIRRSARHQDRLDGGPRLCRLGVRSLAAVGAAGVSWAVCGGDIGYRFTRVWFGRLSVSSRSLRCGWLASRPFPGGESGYAG
jgi:hypothetical protein